MRLLGFALALGVSLSACSNPDIGKACTKTEDCGEGLLCDVHDGKGTCQGPHGHSEGDDTAAHDSEHHDSEPTTGASDSTGG